MITMSFNKIPNESRLAYVGTNKYITWCPCSYKTNVFETKYKRIVFVKVTVNDYLFGREKKVKKQVEWEVNNSKRKGGKGWNR